MVVPVVLLQDDRIRVGAVNAIVPVPIIISRSSGRSSGDMSQTEFVLFIVAIVVVIPVIIGFLDGTLHDVKIETESHWKLGHFIFFPYFIGYALGRLVSIKVKRR